MSLLVFAGGSQIAAVGVVLAGGSPFAAVAAGAVLNTRLFPYGLAVADVVGPVEKTDPDRADRADGPRCGGNATAPGAATGPTDTGAPAAAGAPAAGGAVGRWLIRLLGAHIITDE